MDSWRLRLQNSIQVMKLPYPTPKQLPTPISKQQGPQLEITTLRSVSGRPPPHQWITSYWSRWIWEFIQYMARFEGFSSCIILRCFCRQQSSWPSVNLAYCIYLVNSVLFFRQVRETSSPPKWMMGSVKMLLSSSSTSLSTSQVFFMVTSSGPIYPAPKVQAISLFCGAFPQLAAWPGVSNSGMTLTPLTIAYLTTSLASSVVQVSSSLKLPYCAISGCLSNISGKESSSVMCQCSTFILLYIMASMVSRIRCRGMKCRAESIISPRYTNYGWSSVTIIGRFSSWHDSREWLWLQRTVWVNVQSACTKAAQVGAVSWAFYVVTLMEQVSQAIVKTLRRVGSVMFTKTGKEDFSSGLIIEVEDAKFTKVSLQKKVFSWQCLIISRICPALSSLVLILQTMWQGFSRGLVAPGSVAMQLWGIGKNLNWQPLRALALSTRTETTIATSMDLIFKIMPGSNRGLRFIQSFNPGSAGCPPRRCLCRTFCPFCPRIVTVRAWALLVGGNHRRCCLWKSHRWNPILAGRLILVFAILTN